jgi:hypothetical protein
MEPYDGEIHHSNEPDPETMSISTWLAVNIPRFVDGSEMKRHPKTTSKDAIIKTLLPPKRLKNIPASI